MIIPLKHSSLLSLALSVSAASVNALELPRYRVYDLGTLGGTEAIPYDINSYNIVVGQSLNPDELPRGFKWDGAMTELSFGDDQLRTPMAINDSGVIAGQGELAGVVGVYTLNGSDWTWLGHLGGTGAGLPRAINNSGKVAGWSRNAQGRNRAFFWDGTMHDLGTLGGKRSEAFDMNETDEVVGYAEDVMDRPRATVWRNGVATNLGAAFADRSYAFAISQSGTIVGQASLAGVYSAVIWKDDVPHVIGTLPGMDESVLVDVNDAGVATGSVYAPGTGFTSRAVIFTDEGGLQLLYPLVIQPPELVLLSADAINAEGTIAGVAVNALNDLRGYVAFPLPPCPADVTRDGLVDVLDFLDFLDAFGQCNTLPGPCVPLGLSVDGDFNGDTTVDVSDFLDFFDAFGQADGACPS